MRSEKSDGRPGLQEAGTEIGLEGLAFSVVRDSGKDQANHLKKRPAQSQRVDRAGTIVRQSVEEAV
jgi:hypothetical protein